jgi:multidrug efflux pump subunit AcrA (membrane-fusion protein)
MIGCKPAEHGHDHDGDHGHETESHSHGDDAQSFSGATHKEGKGITLLPETEKRLGLRLAEVKEESVAKEIEFTALVFATESNKTLLASGWLPASEAKSTGTAVKLRSATGALFDGTIAKAVKSVSTNEAEIIIRFAAKNIPLGSFLQVTAKIESTEPAITIPREALIAGTTETFVYVQNGNAYLRTIVEPGRGNKDSVEIKDGLLEGDHVVTRGALDLWLVELRAVKGGQGCCPAPPVKGKKT